MVLDIKTVEFCVGIENGKNEKSNKTGNNKAGCALMIICLVFALICVCISPVDKAFLFIGIFFVALFGLTFFLTKKQKLIQEKVKKLDFYFVEDTCIGKYVDNGSSDSTPTPYLCFAKHGDKSLSTPFSSQFLVPSYDETQKGDAFYFLYVGKRYISMFNKKSWELDTSQFEECDGRICPIKK